MVGVRDYYVGKRDKFLCLSVRYFADYKFIQMPGLKTASVRLFLIVIQSLNSCVSRLLLSSSQMHSVLFHFFVFIFFGVEGAFGFISLARSSSICNNRFYRDRIFPRYSHRGFFFFYLSFRNLSQRQIMYKENSSS